jgi:hypothetical protein
MGAFAGSGRDYGPRMPEAAAFPWKQNLRNHLK